MTSLSLWVWGLFVGAVLLGWLTSPGTINYLKGLVTKPKPESLYVIGKTHTGNLVLKRRK